MQSCTVVRETRKQKAIYSGQAGNVNISLERLPNAVSHFLNDVFSPQTPLHSTNFCWKFDEAIAELSKWVVLSVEITTF